MISSKNILALLIFILLSIACDQQSKIADLVIINGKIETLDHGNKIYQALAVNNDTISALGTTEEISKMIGDKTEVIKLNNQLVIPGFNDSHAHLWGVGQSALIINLRTAKNWDEIVFMIANAANKAKPGEWILGRGWHQEKWDPAPTPDYEGYPYHNSLSAATPRNPVMLTHASGHAIYANNYAMKLAGIVDSTKNPEGGRIIRDSLSGKPIGVFEENASSLISDVYIKQNKMNGKMLSKLVSAAEKECLKYGITSFTDAGSSFEEVNFLKELADSNKLNIRLNIMLGMDNESYKKNIADYKLIGYGNHFLNVRSIKKYVDGALGSRGAWLLEEYSDLPGHFGQNVTELSKLEETANIALENGFQLCTHAIGDRGNREVLKIYEKVLSKNEDGKNLRWRIEHAQHLNPNDIEKFAQNGIIAAMQGIHCTSDAGFVIKRLGFKRAKEGAYVWRKLMDSGAIICNGTDAPVESVNPFDNYFALVTRLSSNGKSFFPEQRMNRLEALKAYTLNGAFASFEEGVKGTLEIGKLADIAILSKDITSIPTDEIRKTETLYTIVGGKIKYQSK